MLKGIKSDKEAKTGGHLKRIGELNVVNEGNSFSEKGSFVLEEGKTEDNPEDDEDGLPEVNNDMVFSKSDMFKDLI